MAKSTKGMTVEVEAIQTLQEAHETVEAIRKGAVDAFLMTAADGGEEVFVLKEANHPYRLFVEQMNDGAVTLSNEGIILYANTYFADLLKSPLEQLIGAPFENFLTNRGLLRPLLQENSAGNVETELLASDGAKVPTYISYSPLRSGKDSWICLIIMDVSEQKQQQALLQESQRLAAIGRTAAVLSHEIANPLSAMSSTVQLMQRQAAKFGAGDVLRDQLELLSEEIDRLSALLTNFRSLSHPAQLNLVATDVASLVTETVNLLATEAMETGIQIEHRFSPDVPLLSLDSEKMKQVLLNLCKNAIQAMPNGGKLTIHTRIDGGSVEIEIRDTGVGVVAGVDIFDFFTTTKPGGSGLGLPVVRQIVTAHGGRVTYVSEPAQGTSFLLTFPLKERRVCEK
jgi:two-component system sporulation sensor kinase A